jgi:hypothetical protein
MFLFLLIVAFFILLTVSSMVARLFAKPIDDILKRIINDPISSAWTRCLQCAIYVVGISSIVRIYNLGNYVNPQPNIAPLGLTQNRWVLELYRTQGLAGVLLVLFVVPLNAFVIVRAFEFRHKQVA